MGSEKTVMMLTEHLTAWDTSQVLIKHLSCQGCFPAHRANLMLVHRDNPWHRYEDTETGEHHHSLLCRDMGFSVAGS